MRLARQHSTDRQLRECDDCGLFQVVPRLPSGVTARCIRCEAVLRRSRRNPLVSPLAWALAGLALYAVAVTLPFMGLDLYGLSRDTVLLSAASQLDRQGVWELAALFIAFVVVLPGLKLLFLAVVLGGLHLPRPPRLLATLFRWHRLIGPWAMVEVFLLGLLVAYTRLLNVAQIEVGPAVYALCGLMLAMVATDATLDPISVWNMLEARGVGVRPAAIQGSGPAAGCETCGTVSRLRRDGRGSCWLCGAALRQRKPASMARTWALLITAGMLYVPANVYPVMTVISFGRGTPNTIFSGMLELASRGLWPLALLVFVASITIPLVKILALGLMLVSVHRGWTGRLRDRTRLYRIVAVIGRWSMIDIFMLSVLVALVRLGFIASVRPGSGAIAFAAVVVLTMFAAMSFDPRLMWDAAGERRHAPAALVPGVDAAR